MVSFLFWNLNKLRREDRVERLVSGHHVDVLIPAECGVSQDDVVKALYESGGPQFHATWSATRKVDLFTRYPPTALKDVFCHTGGRYTIRWPVVDDRIDLLLAAVHFYSKQICHS
jgi:hypothetical protein